MGRWIYQRTGVLPPPKPFDRRVLSFDELDDPDAVLDVNPHPVPGLEFTLDLNELRRQVERFSRKSPLAPKPRPALAPIRTFTRSARDSYQPGPIFQRDVGRGASRVEPLQDLITQLSDPDSRRRALAADELGRGGAAYKSALPQLMKAATDSSPRVRASSVLALGRIVAGEEGVAEILKRALEDPVEDVRYAARMALMAPPGFK